MCFCHSFLLSCCLLQCGESRPGSENAKEQQKLEGTWSFVEAPGGGGQTQQKRPAVQIVFKGETITFLAADKKRTVRGTYAVDSGKNPKTMDITLDRDGVRVVTQAIYELDGDNLRLCHYLGALASKERPMEFAVDKRTVLGTLKREKN